MNVGQRLLKDKMFGAVYGVVCLLINRRRKINNLPCCGHCGRPYEKEDIGWCDDCGSQEELIWIRSWMDRDFILEVCEECSGSYPKDVWIEIEKEIK